MGTNLAHTVTTDKPQYTESDQALFSVPISNAGSSARDALVLAHRGRLAVGHAARAGAV